MTRVFPDEEFVFLKKKKEKKKKRKKRKRKKKEVDGLPCKVIRLIQLSTYIIISNFWPNHCFFMFSKLGLVFNLF